METPKYQWTEQPPAACPEPVEADEPERVITVRLPRAMHVALKERAHDERTSLNKLCVAALADVLQPADEPAPAA